MKTQTYCCAFRKGNTCSCPHFPSLQTHETIPPHDCSTHTKKEDKKYGLGDFRGGGDAFGGRGLGAGLAGGEGARASPEGGAVLGRSVFFVAISLFGCPRL